MSKVKRLCCILLYSLFCSAQAQDLGLTKTQDADLQSFAHPPKPTEAEFLTGLQGAVNITANLLCALDASLCSGTGGGGGGGGQGQGPNYETTLYYELPITRFARPGVQTRTMIDPVFPATYFDQYSQLPVEANSTRPPLPLLSRAQKNAIYYSRDSSGASGHRRLQAAPPPPAGQIGGWTMYSVDSGVEVIHAIPLTNGQCFFMERPGNREAPPQIAAVYNLNSNTYKRFPMTDSPFCSGHVQLRNGSVLVVGGTNAFIQTNFADGRYNVRIFNPGANPSYSTVAVMQPNAPASVDPNSGARWYPSMLTMPDGNVLFASGETTEGGTYPLQGITFVNPTYQFFQIATNNITNSVNLPLLTQTDPINLYPFLAYLPSGRVMIISGNTTQFFRYTPGLLTRDTSTYPAIPQLPVPALYPQTSCIVLLPLELSSNYASRILVVGGSSADRADANTPATANTYLLDLTQSNPTWRVETMSAARVMPDVVILPDGTLFICNGANLGIAGGSPGGGTAINQNGNPLAGEIYNPAATFGSRMSGLLANSGRDRLYHSVAWLTRNAEVLVTGSETTGDYTMQIYTPPYLTGSFVRPLITNPSSTSPGYGARISLNLAFAPSGQTATISRVVMISDNGITHSTHFDQKSIQCQFTQAGSVLFVTMPPNANVAPPANYMLFAVTSTGRPSQAAYVGLGGATPLPLYTDPVVRPLFANGTYTITSRARTGSCAANLSYQFCNTSNTVVMDTQGVWQLNIISTANQPNTYTVQSYARTGSCNTYMGAQLCSNSDNVYLFPRDDLSGLQEWTITAAAGGGYNIRVLIGRNGCGASNTVLTASACGAASVSLVGGATALGVWDITAVTAPAITPQAPYVPPLANAQYTIQGQGRTGCSSNLTYLNDCSTNDISYATGSSALGSSFYFQYQPNNPLVGIYNIIAYNRGGDCRNYLSSSPCGNNQPDLFYTDDGSGRQQYQVTRTASGAYNLAIPVGRGAGCTTYLSSQACGTSNFLTFAATTSSALTSFNIAPVTFPVYFPNGIYQIANVERTTCNQILSPATCANGNAVTMGPSGTFQLTYLPNAPNPNTYDVTVPQRSQCAQYLSSGGCGNDIIDLYFQDDGSGRQQWVFTQTTNGNYNIQILNGRVGCATFAVATSCAAGNGVTFGASGAAGQYATWSVTAAPQPGNTITDGQYQIMSVGRTCTNSYLGAQLCSQGQGTQMSPGATWTLTTVPNAAQINTFNVLATGRIAAQCASTYLSTAGCGANNPNLVDIFTNDDGSGRQQWIFTPAPGGYTITIAGGRTGCNQFLSTIPCGSGDTIQMSGTNNSLSVWTLTSGAAPAPVTQLLANGNYYIQSAGRLACGNYTSALTNCSGNTAVGNTALSGSGLSVWTFTSLGNNLYNIVSSSRLQCYNFLSTAPCGNNLVDLFAVDDGSGRQQWLVTALSGGAYTLSLTSGRVGCETYLSASACGGSTALSLASSNTTSLQAFTITPVNSAAG